MKDKKSSPRAALGVALAELADPAGSGPELFCAEPLGNLLPFEPCAGFPARSGPGRCPDRVLAELLTLNEEMIEQLRAERLGVAGTADFIMGMIEQHENAAALLRAQLEGPGKDSV